MSTEIWQKIDRLDFASIKEKLKFRKGWWWNWWTNLDAIEKEYKQFLYLIATNPGKTVVPWSEKLDDLWHEHILDTSRYQRDCQELFGQFIHHNPHLAVGSASQVEAFKETREMYRTAFGEKVKSKSSSAPGCGTFMPIVFCATHGSGHAHSDCGPGDSGCHGDSGGSACGSSCGGGGCGGT